MSLFGKVLVPVDGSPPSDAAVEFAVRFAADQAAELVFVNICEVARVAGMLSSSTMTVDPSYALAAERESGDEALAAAVRMAEQGRIPCQAIHEDGACVDSILSIARREGADVIVVGSHGRSGIARAMLGSVAEGILRRADVPVLVTRVHPHLSVVHGTKREDRVLAPVASFAESESWPRQVDPIC